MKRENRWRVRSRQYDFEWEGPLEAYWEVEGDPISDDYTPDEVDARELLVNWAKQYGDSHPDGLIPIHWFVISEEAGQMEAMPFEYDHLHGEYPIENFLNHFDWPVHATTGKPVNWLTIPVVDKRWNAKKASKGGFIQEATGWKPSILQPFVYVPALLKASGP
jgi:hypothetical protein